VVSTAPPELDGVGQLDAGEQAQRVETAGGRDLLGAAHHRRGDAVALMSWVDADPAQAQDPRLWLVEEHAADRHAVVPDDQPTVVGQSAPYLVHADVGRGRRRVQGRTGSEGPSDHLAQLRRVVGTGVDHRESSHGDGSQRRSTFIGVDSPRVGTGTDEESTIASAGRRADRTDREVA
jgi:hypothetical protein